MDDGEFNAVVNPAMDWNRIQGGIELLHAVQKPDISAGLI